MNQHPGFSLVELNKRSMYEIRTLENTGEIQTHHHRIRLSLLLLWNSFHKRMQPSETHVQRHKSTLNGQPYSKTHVGFISIYLQQQWLCWWCSILQTIYSTACVDQREQTFLWVGRQKANPLLHVQTDGWCVTLTLKSGQQASAAAVTNRTWPRSEPFTLLCLCQAVNTAPLSKCEEAWTAQSLKTAVVHSGTTTLFCWKVSSVNNKKKKQFGFFYFSVWKQNYV